MKFRNSLLYLCIAAMAVLSEPAVGCSVCFGDSESPMAKGAVAGVIVMVAVVGFVLTGIAGTACLFFVRSRRLQLSSQPSGSDS